MLRVDGRVQEMAGGWSPNCDLGCLFQGEMMRIYLDMARGWEHGGG